MKRAIIAASICLVVLLGGCMPSQSFNDWVAESDKRFVSEINDTMISVAKEVARHNAAKTQALVVKEQLTLLKEQEEKRIAEEEVAAQEEYYEEFYYDDSGTYYGGGGYRMPYSDLYGENGPVIGMPGWYGDPETGYVETMYNASAHKYASSWTLDDEGFYHDDNGRYVIGVSRDEINPETGQGYQYGDVVQTGKGEAVVYDYGQGVDNVHDFATIHY